jgi:hypothetical protein
VDLQARLDRHVTLLCRNCRRRIAWTTVELAARYGSGAWRWQSKRVPIRYRMDDGVVELECFSCGWEASPPVWEPPLGRVLMAPYYAGRITDQDLADFRAQQQAVS